MSLHSQINNPYLKPLFDAINRLINVLRRLLLSGLMAIIRGYQLLISPVLNSQCLYYPSCSQYSMDALKTHGILRGSYFSVRRICRCRPGCIGGYDPVPEKN